MKKGLGYTSREASRVSFGVNYWASHAGMFMWRRWDIEEVRADLDLLAAYGFGLLRLFPLWPDFQPIHTLRGFAGEPKEYRLRTAENRSAAQPLPADEYGRHGMDPVMVHRFDQLIAEAERRGFELNVSLINGWMSGRLFVPPALEGKNILTDPEAIRWAVRFARFFARRYAGRSSIVGWDIGNETNCMGEANRDQAWLWTCTLAQAIRSEDPETPIVSGMHGLSLDGPWRIGDQAECTDVLTTHPYSDFVPYCNNEGADSLRTMSHPAAESQLYGDVGGRPVLCQEINTLGPMLAGPEQMVRFAGTTALSLWAHNVSGMVWWCAFDQNEIDAAPYDWNALERELGLFTADRSPKPVVEALRTVMEGLQSVGEAVRSGTTTHLPSVPGLSPPKTQATCVLTREQDHWAVAFSSFILAKQVGVDVQFADAEQPLPEHPVYLLPSVTGYEVLSRRTWNELKRRVAAGAHLYVSLDNAFLSEFQKVFGLTVQRRQKRREQCTFQIESLASGTYQVPFDIPFQTQYEPAPSMISEALGSEEEHTTGSLTADVSGSKSEDTTGSGTAEVLGAEVDGTPVFIRHGYGRGVVYLLTIPIERGAAETPGIFDSDREFPWWRIYATVLKTALEMRAIRTTNPSVFVTEHDGTDDGLTVVGVNMGQKAARDTWTVNERYQVSRVLVVSVRAGDGAGGARGDTDASVVSADHGDETAPAGSIPVPVKTSGGGTVFAMEIPSGAAAIVTLAPQ